MAEDQPAMTSNRPYLLRAIYDWISDNGLRPHLLVDASRPGVRVPASAIRDGQVVLNIAMHAVADLDLGNERVRCKARFGGVSQVIDVPLTAVQAIYAQENGQGMMFPVDEEGGDTPPPSSPDPVDEPTAPGADEGGDKPKRGAPHLRVVK